MKAKFVGGKNSSTNSQANTVSNNDQAQSTVTKGKQQSNTAATPNDVDPIVVGIIKSVKARQIPITSAASMIVGRIRVRFVNAIRNNKENSQFGYEITSFQYLDEVLFNDMTYIINSVMQFGSRGTIPLSYIMRMITDTANLIEYYIPEDDYTSIRNILGAVYNEF